MAVDHRRIRSALAGQAIGGEIVFRESVGSTNDVAAEHAEAGFGEGLVVVANDQVSGRGRRGASWFAEPGGALILSILLRPEFPRPRWGRITPVAALAVCRALEIRTGLQPRIKWPNDLLFGDCKVAGMLAESVSGGENGDALVMGIGANITTPTEKIPPDLREIATSVAIESKDNPVPRIEEIIIAFLQEFGRLYPLCGTAEFAASLIPEIQSRSALIGQVIHYFDGGREHTARAVGIGAEGELIVVTPDGREHSLTSAEQVRAVAGE